MKLLIIEGLDRCGKDTLIQSVKEDFPANETIHWGFPKGETNLEKTEYQKMSFGFWMRDYKFKKAKNELDLLVWNRSHIGECVYGPLYRDSDPSWIFEMEENYLNEDMEVYLVLLYADPEFLVKNDDGNSFTNDTDKKRIEMERFIAAFMKSNIPNKLMIKVNDDESYIPQEKIYRRVKNFFNS